MNSTPVDESIKMKAHIISCDKTICQTKMMFLSSIGLLWLLLLTVFGETDARRNRVCKLDLAFVIDSSTSIGYTDFKKQINFVKDIVGFLDVDNDKTRIAAVTYSENVVDVLKFSDLQTNEGVLRRIGGIQHQIGKATRTYLALEYVHKTVFASGNGERPDVVDVVVVLTDGATNPGSLDSHTDVSGKKQTQIEASMIKRRPAYIFTIGVGDEVDIAELNGMSSNPDSRFTITVDSFSKLDTDEIKRLLYENACEDPLPPPPPPPPPNPKCQGDLGDVFLVLDQSSSIHNVSTFKQEVNFVQHLVRQFDIGPNKVQVGALKFSTNPQMLFYLNTYRTQASVSDAISRITWKGGDTYLAKALRIVRTWGLVPAYGSRAARGIPQIVVVITDAEVHDKQELYRELRRFHQQGFIVFAIGVGQNIDYNQMENIANSRDRMFSVTDLYSLYKIKDQLLRVLCASLRVSGK